MTVRVTKEHIKLGVKNLCPITIALHVHLKLDVCYARCGRSCILLINRYPFGLLGKYSLPRKAQEFMKAFHRGEKVKPIVFEVGEM